MAAAKRRASGLVCMSDGPDCRGRVAYRTPLSGTGASTLRCDGHWEARLDLEDQLNRRYPRHAPSDWSPDDAGESWGGDY